MAFDTLAYAKHLEQAGVDRLQAEAHAEAMNQYLRPDLATKTDIDALEQSTQAETASIRADIVALEQRIEQRLVLLEQRLERLIHQTQLQTLGIMAAMLGILFALLRFTGHSS
jgi:hypothetical protein